MSEVARQSFLTRISAFSEGVNVMLLGAMLALCQLLDGILTSIGVSRFGTDIEGNPLLRGLMEEFGHIPALSVVKAAAVVIVVALTIIATKLPWVRNAMGALTCLYVFSAILPWTYLLFIQPHI